jgi:hypothetical protein
MSTEAQINANRQNAQKSTGPRTARGKKKISKNAIKHGLFADALIIGESEADYEVFHDEMLADLAPVGAVETMMAERVISLWWRLRRAERMQNQALSDMMENYVTNPLPRRMHVLECHAMGVPLGDARCTERHMPLGRIARLDWGHNKVLERMIMYEKRIESSLNKTMNELTRHQVIRRVEGQEEEEKEQPAPNEKVIKAFDPSAMEGPIRDDHIRMRERETNEYWDRAFARQIEAEKQAELKKQGQDAGQQPEIYTLDTRTMKIEKQKDSKKQSQSQVRTYDAKAFLKIAYGDDAAKEAGENKADQTQPQRDTPRGVPFDAPFSSEREPGMEQPPSVANS